MCWVPLQYLVVRGSLICARVDDGLAVVYTSPQGAELQLPDSIAGQRITDIAAGALRGNDAQMVRFPLGLRRIGDYAFYQCEQLTEAILPGLLRSIGDRAFAGCTALTRVYVPPTVDQIGEAAFEGAEGVILTGAEGSAIHRYAEAHGLFFMGANDPAA